MTVFFAKRMLAVSALCLLIAIPMRGNWLLFCGFVVGCGAALCKVRLWHELAARLLSREPSASESSPIANAESITKSNTKSFLSWVLPIVTPFFSFIILALTVMADKMLFFGCAAGMLSLPVLIVVNTYTEKMSLSHNRWGS